MADDGSVRTVAASYTVTAWPEGMADCPDAAAWCVTVEARGRGLWAVVRGTGYGAPCLDSDGNWAYEPIPPGRDDEWRARHRFPLERALELAREIAPRLEVNGMTTLERIALHRERTRGARE